MIDTANVILNGDSVSLKSLRTSDITDEYVNGLNDPAVNKYLVTVRLRTQSRQSVAEFITSCSQSSSDIFFGIFLKTPGEPFIGTVRVSGIDFFHHSASIGICLFAKRAWGKGYAKQALLLVKSHLFENLGLHYLEAGIYAANEGSIRAFSSAGFQEQYRIRNKFRYTASFEDVLIFAAINPTFDFSLLTQS